MRPTTSVTPPGSAAGRLGGEDDQQAQEVGVALERLTAVAITWSGAAEAVRPSVELGQVGEEALGAALHDREQDPSLEP
jgi:hypothetical protein